MITKHSKFFKEKFKTHIIEDSDGGMECDIHFTR